MASQIWNKVIRDGRFELDLIRQLYHIDNWRGERFPMAGISCILPLPHVVYTGDEYGRVVSTPAVCIRPRFLS